MSISVLSDALGLDPEGWQRATLIDAEIYVHEAEVTWVFEDLHDFWIVRLDAGQHDQTADAETLGEALQVAMAMAVALRAFDRTLSDAESSSLPQ